LVVFTASSPFYVTLHGCCLLDNTGAYCPKKPHNKDSNLYKYTTNNCKNNLERSTDSNANTLIIQDKIRYISVMIPYNILSTKGKLLFI